MGAGVKHYFKDGKQHKGAYHKHPDGTMMTGKNMSKSSKKLFHYGDLSNAAKKKAKESWRSKNHKKA
jgi:hypothetical protein